MHVLGSIDSLVCGCCCYFAYFASFFLLVSSFVCVVWTLFCVCTLSVCQFQWHEWIFCVSAALLFDSNEIQRAPTAKMSFFCVHYNIFKVTLSTAIAQRSATESSSRHAGPAWWRIDRGRDREKSLQIIHAFFMSVHPKFSTLSANFIRRS